MKKSRLLVSVVMLVIIGLAITSASLAWYPVVIKAAKSLDYVTLSETVVTFELSRAEFMAKVYPAQAVPGAVSLGKPLGSVFDTAGTNNIQTQATIGASKLNLAYYGSEGSSSAMRIVCSVSSTLADGTSVDLNKDINYIVCAQGYGLSIDEKWLINPTKIPNTTYWQETEPNVFEEYTMDPSDGYYLLDTNVSHRDLIDTFGINNYRRICTYESSVFSNWDDENYKIDEEFKAAVQATVSNNNEQFVYNHISFSLTKMNDIYSVYVEDEVGTIATSKEMNLDFLVLIWYNKVDELLDPATALGEISISIRVNTD